MQRLSAERNVSPSLEGHSEWMLNLWMSPLNTRLGVAVTSASTISSLGSRSVLIFLPAFWPLSLVRLNPVANLTSFSASFHNLTARSLVVSMNSWPLVAGSHLILLIFSSIATDLT